MFIDKLSAPLTLRHVKISVDSSSIFICCKTLSNVNIISVLDTKLFAL